MGRSKHVFLREIVGVPRKTLLHSAAFCFYNQSKAFSQAFAVVISIVMTQELPRHKNISTCLDTFLAVSHDRHRIS